LFLKLQNFNKDFTFAVIFNYSGNKMYKENSKDYNPAMHSVEHILNQTMIRMFQCGRAFNAHIEKKKSKCDYRIERNLTEEERQAVEDKVNEVIAADMPVTEDFYSREEAAKIISLSRMPEDAGETVRVIKIGDYDICPCSGVHVKSTSEIGNFKIISTSCDTGFLRLRFKLQ
jgi:Ser-tRNA(Ala) deacylase AlaX